MGKAGRPPIEFDKKTFADLVGMGCTQEEICWFFRDETGKVANVDTLSRWCKRTYGVNFQEFSKQNKGMALRIKLRQIQFRLAESSTAMAIWLGKQYLGQKDQQDIVVSSDDDSIKEMEKYFANKKRNSRPSL